MVKGDLLEPVAHEQLDQQIERLELEEGARDWADLPFDAMNQMLRAVGDNDTASLRLVCRVWQACIDKSVSSLALRAWPQYPSKLAAFPSLTSLTIGVAPPTAQQIPDTMGHLLKTLAQLPKLQQLSLKCWSAIRSSSLDNVGLLTNLTSLRIGPLPGDDLFSKSCGTKFLEGLGKLTRLRYLNLSDLVAGPGGLPAEIQCLSALEHLDVSSNLFAEIPELSPLTALTYLNVSGSMLCGMPKGLTKLSKLVHLNINGQSPLRVDGFWQGSSQLSSLEVLLADGSVLHEVPEGIGGFTGLTSLSLIDNKLCWLPNTMSSLTNLVSLNLRSNRLGHLPPVLFTLPRLAELDVSDNAMDYDEPGPKLDDNLGRLTSLRSLKASHNEYQCYTVDKPRGVGSCEEPIQGARCCNDHESAAPYGNFKTEGVVPTRQNLRHEAAKLRFTFNRTLLTGRPKEVESIGTPAALWSGAA